MSKIVGTVTLGAFAIGSLLVLGQVYLDFTSWSYSHTGLKFRYGAHLLPAILVFVFVNGLIAIHLRGKLQEPASDSQSVEPLQCIEQVSHDTSLPLRP